MNNRMDNDGRLPPRKRARTARQSLIAAAILAAVSGLCAFSDQAGAVPVSITGDDTVTVPSASFNPAPFSSSLFSNSLTASVPDVDRSPFQGTVHDGLTYSAVQNGGSALYNLTGTSLSLFWGSPDAFNTITFFSGIGGTGTSTAFTGSSLVPFGATLGTGHDLVTFAGSFASVLFGSSANSFEYTFAADPTATPLPAALPLYAAGVGVMGLLGWRRKRKLSAAAVA